MLSRRGGSVFMENVGPEMDSNTQDKQQEGTPRGHKEMLIVTHSEMARRAVPWLAQKANVHNTELLVANCVLNPVAVPGRQAAWTLIENPRKVRNALRKAVAALPAGTVTLLDKISDIVPSQQITRMVQQEGIDVVYFPLDAQLDLSSPDMQFGQRLLHDVPCDVVLIDLGKVDTQASKRIIVPMDLNASGHAIRHLVEIGSEIGTVVPIHISPDFGADSEEIALSELDLQLKEIGIKEDYPWLSPEIVIAEGFHHGIMQAMKKNDAIILGGSTVRMIHDLRCETVALRPQIAESITIGVYRPAEFAAKTMLGRISKRLKATIPELTLADRVSLFDRIQGGARLTPDFAVMIGLSVLMASLGLLADNSSVVIGAMLVAPFMTSVVGIGLALVQGNIALMKRSGIAMGAGLVIGFSLSFFVGLIVPLDELPLEVLARGDPDIMDMAIAFVSGMAAAYAVSRESVAESIVGVAIAAALVPPLACVGIMFSQGNIIKAEGALTLLITNLAAIALGAALVFRHLGVPGTRTEHKSYVLIRRISTSLIVMLFILSIPLVYRLGGKLATGQIRPMNFRVSSRVKSAVLNQIAKHEGLAMLLIGRSGSGDKRRIKVLLSTEEPVPGAVIEGIRGAVKDILGKKASIEVGVFQNAILADPERNTADPPLRWESGGAE